MADARKLSDQEKQPPERSDDLTERLSPGEAMTALAAQGFQATEAIADALAAALRGLPGKLRELEVPRVKHSLEEVAGQLTAIAARLRRLGRHLAQAGRRFNDALLQESGKLIVDGFEAVASVAQFLQPDAHGVLRWLPGTVTRPYLEALGRIEAGLRAAGDLAQIGVAALPDLAEGLENVAEDLERAADLLDATARTIRELSSLVPI